MKNKKENLEDLFKDSFENFEAEVNPGVWKNIQTGLKGAGLGVLIKVLFNKIGTSTLVAVVSSAATVVGTVLVMNWTAADEKPKTENETPVVVPKTVVEKPSATEIKEFLADDKTPAPIQVKETPVAAENTTDRSLSENTNQGSISVKKDKQKIEEAIKSLSGGTVASISSSVIGGSVPLIVNLNNLGTGKINKWDFGAGKKETGANPVHVYDVPGIYCVKLSATSADGKTAVDSVKIEVFGNSSVNTTSKMDFFTPNGDGDRDEFTFSSANIKEMRIVIANEKRDIVYIITSQKDPIAKWDGKDMKGKPVNEGTYYYFVNAVGLDGKKIEQKGKINLTR
ncbi:MAG: gliding motility-associated C-terminal domain-containing protein [Bacteroidota bacterium]|nr:gliding motility-associated C-terminal domain-containing protein [Bacteroidota bacterium]